MSHFLRAALVLLTLEGFHIFGAEQGCPRGECEAEGGEEASLLVLDRRKKGAMCPYGGAWCDGNQCCPGRTEHTGFESYQCPNADEWFNGCGYDNRPCVEESGVCLSEAGARAGGAERMCCGGFVCVPVPGNYAGEKRCFPAPPPCVPTGEVCSHDGLTSQQCCDSKMVCTSLAEDDTVQFCVPPRPPPCVAAFESCEVGGGEECCGEFQCVPMVGGRRGRCIPAPPPLCMKLLETCSDSQTCCGELECTAALGSSYAGKQCLPPKPTTKTTTTTTTTTTACSNPGMLCGGRGRPDADCCFSLECRDVDGTGRERRCAPPAPILR